MKKKLKTIFQIIAVLSFFGILAYSVIDPNGSVREERINQEAISTANQKAEIIKREIFCEEYRKIVETKDEAPYGYKYCFN